MLTPLIAVALLLCTVGADNSTSDTCALEPWDSGPWAATLEEWALTATEQDDGFRHGRVMSLPLSPEYYVTDRGDHPPRHPHGPPPHGPPPHGPPPHGPPPHGPPPHGPPPHGPPHGPMPYSEWQPPPNSEGNGKIVNRPGGPGGPYKEKPFKPSPSYPPPPNQLPPYQTGNPPYQGSTPPYQSGNPPYQGGNPPYQGGNPPYQGNPHRGPGPMPPHHPPVDRVDEPPPRKQVTETDLYLLTAIEKLVYRVDLMEKRLRKLEENVHYIVAGADKKPDPCVSNFTRVGEACYHFSSETTDWKSANLYCRKLRANLLELDDERERRQMFAAMLGDKKIRGTDIWTGGLNPGLLWIWSHSARPVIANTTAAGAAGSNATAITIVGEGRCLALVYDPAVNNYVYRGQDCSLRHRYVCEKAEDKARLGNEIERVARGLSHSARQARLLLTGVGKAGDAGDTEP